LWTTFTNECVYERGYLPRKPTCRNSKLLCANKNFLYALVWNKDRNDDWYQF
jgi:hypothetical protein